MKSLDVLFDLASDKDEAGDPRPVVVRLCAAAKARIRDFVNQWGARHQEAEGAMAAALAKLEAIPGRFALIHHCVRSAPFLSDTDPISLISIEAGIRLAEWCENETARVYRMLGESVEEKELHKLVDQVSRIAGRNGGRLTVKLLQKSNSRKYRTSIEAKVDLERLVGHDLGRWEDGPVPCGGGKQQIFFVPTPPTGDSLEPEEPYCMTSDDTDRQPSSGERHVQEQQDHRLEPAGPGAEAPDPTLGVIPFRRITSGDPDVSTSRRWSNSSEVVQGQTSGSGSLESGAGTLEVDTPEVSIVEQSADPVADVPFILVTTPESIASACAAVANTGKPIGLDIETTGLRHAQEQPRLLSLATTNGIFLIDLFGIDPRSLWTALGSAEIVGHNLAFDLPFLMRLGFVPGRVADTMLASQVLHAGDIGVRHALKDLAARHLGVVMDKRLQKSDWSGTLSPEMLRYAAQDAVLPLRLWEKLKNEVGAAGLADVVIAEMAALPCVAWASMSGVGFDRAAWEAVAAEAEENADRLRERMDDLAPNAGNLLGVTNWNSPDQVMKIMRAAGLEPRTRPMMMHLPPQTTQSPTRSASTAPPRSWPARMVEPGSGTPVQGIACTPTGSRSGPGASGRMSCKDPDLQQLPRDRRYRKCFIAPAGRVLVKADYSQIELRIAAKMTGDRRMLDAYRNGEDLHTLTARRCSGRTRSTRRTGSWRKP